MSNYVARRSVLCKHVIIRYLDEREREIARREKYNTSESDEMDIIIALRALLRACVRNCEWDNRWSPIASFTFRAFQQIQDINSQVAQFRDLLINIGQPRDGPELREKIRKLRRSCVEACKSTSQLVLPHVKR